MPRALQHEYPRWETDPNDPTGDADFVYPGRPRFVSKQRARKLRKRGVPLMPCHRVHDPHGEHRPGDFYPTHGDRARYAWFEPEAAYESRRRKRARTCYLVATRPEPFGRKGWLRNRLETQRSMLQDRLYIRAWRKAWPRIAEFWASAHIETATGAALDALCGIPFRPPGMTDAEVRACHMQGYAIRATEPTPEDKAAPLTLFVPQLLQREDETDRKFVARGLGTPDR